MEQISAMNKKKFWLWILFFLVLILGSPLLEGGETYHTIIVLRLWVIGFAIYYFLVKLRGDHLEIAVPYGSALLLGLWLVLSVSLLTTHYYYITVYWYSNLLVYFLLFLLFLNLSAESGRTGKLLFGLVLILTLAGAIEGVLGILDYFSHHPGRASGSFFNPAYYSGYLLSLVSFPLAGLLFDLLPELSQKKKLILRLGLGFCTALILGGLLVSASRAMIFALVPIGWVLMFRFRRYALLALLVLVLGLIFIPNPLRTRIQNLKADPYAWDRITIWKGSLRMIRHHPFGVGLGMYQYYYDRYEYPVRTMKIGRYTKHATWAHNEFLNLAVECSCLALALALIWLGAVLYQLLRIALKRREEFLKKNPAMILGFSGSLFGILGHSLVDSNLHQAPIMLVLVLDMAGLIYLLSELQPVLVKKLSYPISHSGFIRWFVLVAGALVGLLMSYQALIYGLTFESKRIENPELRIKYLYRVARVPSGYAGLYFQIGSDLQRLFQQTQNPNFGVQSLPYFEFAARLNPENFDYFYQWSQAIYHLGIFLEQPKFLSRAEQIARLSLERNPHYPYSYLLLADIARREGDLSKQEKWLKDVLEIEPYYFLARLILIDILSEQGRVEDARRELDILKRQKQEVDKIPKAGMNQVQLSLIQIGELEIEEREARLGTNRN